MERHCCFVFGEQNLAPLFPSGHSWASLLRKQVKKNCLQAFLGIDVNACLLLYFDFLMAPVPADHGVYETEYNSAPFYSVSKEYVVLHS
jgi:hypothetical protein